VFVRDEIALNASFAAAQSRLSEVAGDDSLMSLSGDAYEAGLTGLIRVGPLGEVPGISKLVRVQARELVTHDGHAVLTVRWEATGFSGGMFPALDADITLTSVAADQSLLAIDGAYRPPLAVLGAGLDKVILHRVAEGTVRSLLRKIAELVADPKPARSAR
jgi:hypothetical protein